MTEQRRQLADALAERYAIQRELGRGGMATVYLAEDMKHRRMVALKVLHTELARSLGPERFLREVEIAARLDHPHILPVLDSGQADGVLYYVMPFVDGESLRDRLAREKQLPVDDVVRIAREVADALSYAHDRGIVHRDIKPENILLAGAHARVADFGVARALSSAGKETLTATGLAVGTPAYMSPEQAAGAKDLDGRSDVYALGCVCYEMLAGQPPFVGPNAESVVRQHLTTPPVDLTTIRPAVPHSLWEAVRCALAKTPADRFSSASRFGEALELSRIGGTTHAAFRSQRFWWVAAGIGGVILLTAVALRGSSQWRGTPLPVVRSTLVRAAGIDRDGVMGGLAISPDGSMIAYHAPGEGGRQLFVRSLNEGVARPLSGTLGAFAPFFSHDGRWIGYQLGDKLMKIAARGGNPVQIAQGVPLIVGVPTWGPNGKIVFADGLKGLFSLNSDGSEPPRSLTPGGRFSSPQVLPGGDDILVSSNGEIVIISLETGEMSPIGLRGCARQPSTGSSCGIVRYVEPGYILYGDGQGGVMAVPFDFRRRRLTGSPITLAESVNRWDATATALAYIPRRRRELSSLVWVSRDGRISEVDSAWVGDFISLALSPDGKRLAASMFVQPGEERIWVKALPTGPYWQLTPSGRRNHRPAWTPDSRLVTYVADRAIHRQRADGSGQADTLLRDSTALFEASWSRDGRWLIVRQDGEEVLQDLLALRVGKDSIPIRLFTTPLHREMHATFSPDSRWLAYTSDESGVDEVYVRPFPQVSDGKWLVSSGGGTEPIWSRDGREIFYRSGSQQMVAATVSMADTFAIARREVLFDASRFRAGLLNRAYAVDPAGERFLMIREPSPDVRGEIILVQNFVEELRSRGSERPSGLRVRRGPS